MKLRQIPLFFRAWLRLNFPRPAIRVPPWLRRMKLTDDHLRAALLLGGFAAFCWGLWDIAPWLSKIVGGLCLIWFAWPSRGRG